MGLNYADRAGDWIETASGGRFYPEDIRPGDFRIADIAHALSLVNRYTGHTRAAYSVAEHSVRCLREAKNRTDDPHSLLLVLLHDASEAYLSDIARPLKRMPCFDGYRVLEARIQGEIERQFGLCGVRPLVSVTEIDLTLLATEARDLMPSRGDDWTIGFDPLEEPIWPWSATKAKRHFLDEFGILAARVAEAVSP